ncbi:hypothetical protein DVH24_039460 [Malus domestica]|uniref:Uncharacterized protein n=1 Tax=Malus domestica TaxID=3750 RepID=A0A498I2T9_MALDO|nr:hypothetical protein DVH24_039460 [Malus domestica]
MKVWWKQFINKRKRKGVRSAWSSLHYAAGKKFMRTGIEIQFNKTYLATGGEDGVVRIWHVTLVDASSNYLTPQGIFDSKLKKIKYGFQVIFPEKGFRIQESPLQEFHGHSSDVLDLAWSNSNCLVSSSMDKTVRLWEVGRSHCLYIFHHNDYGKCFNPRDDNYFISGSIDGKVRVWGPSEKRVADWADGFVVGSVTGTCHFYEVSRDYLQLVVRMHIHGRKKTSSNQITGVKVLHSMLFRPFLFHRASIRSNSFVNTYFCKEKPQTEYNL